MTDYKELFLASYPLFLQGASMTVKVTLASAGIGFSLGSCFGILTASRFRVPLLSKGIEGVTFLLRAVPFYVWLLIVYFVLPDLLGCNLEPFAASVIALGLSSSGYVCRIVSAGIEAVPQGQFEAAAVLGYRKIALLRYIILPQAFRKVLLLFYNELESLLKSTAVVSSVGLLEITRVGMNIVSREMQPVAVYLTVAFFYVSLSVLLAATAKAIERRVKARRFA